MKNRIVALFLLSVLFILVCVSCSNNERKSSPYKKEDIVESFYKNENIYENLKNSIIKTKTTGDFTLFCEQGEFYICSDDQENPINDVELKNTLQEYYSATKFTDTVVWVKKRESSIVLIFEISYRFKEEAILNLYYINVSEDEKDLTLYKEKENYLEKLESEWYYGETGMI